MEKVLIASYTSLKTGSWAPNEMDAVPVPVALMKLGHGTQTASQRQRLHVQEQDLSHVDLINQLSGGSLPISRVQITPSFRGKGGLAAAGMLIPEYLTRALARQGQWPQLTLIPGS